MPETSSSPKHNALMIPGAIIMGAVIIGVSLIIGLSHGGSGSATQNGAAVAPQQTVNIKDVKTAGEPYIGNANASVTLAFWSDYQCPYCRAFEVGGVPQITTPVALPDIVTTYVNTGKVRIVFKDFEFLGADSVDDGEYARAIWDLYPQHYFAWRTAMYQQQPQENSLSEADNKTHVEKVTVSIPGISLATVEAQIAKKKNAYDAAMQADMQEGESFGIQGTPGFITGTTLIPGDDAFATFAAAIDPQLK